MTKSFLGFPIEGIRDVAAQKRPDQLSQEAVGVLIHTVLSFKGVRGLAWTQYTPYFNDGEPCVFRAGDPYISLDTIVPDPISDYYEYSWMEEDSEENNRHWTYPYNKAFETLIGDDEKVWTGEWPNRTWVFKTPLAQQPNPGLFLAFNALSDAMDNGSCDHALLDLFGDHATVIIDAEAGKVVVDSYDHD